MKLPDDNPGDKFPFDGVFSPWELSPSAPFVSLYINDEGKESSIKYGSFDVDATNDFQNSLGRFAYMDGFLDAKPIKFNGIDMYP